MTIEQTVEAHLKSNAAIAALVGPRIYPVQLPQKPTLPAITYIRVSRKPTQHRGSPRAKHHRCRFQFDVWANTYGGAVAVRSALFDAMGELTRTTNPRVDVSLVQDDRDAFEADPGRWRGIVDYYIWHEGD